MSKTVLVGLDIESTGVCIEKSEPVQIASAYSTLGANGEHSNPKVLFNGLCKPFGEIEPGAIDVHGVTLDHVKYSPSPRSVSKAMVLLIDEVKSVGNLYTVGYNSIAFDLPILSRYDLRYNHHKHIDVFTLCLRELHTYGTKLTELYESYVGKPADGAHDAAVDCLLVLEVLIKYFKETGKTAEELHLELSKPRAYAVFPFGKHVGKPLDAVPNGYAKWCLKNFSSVNPDLQLTLDYIASK